MRHCVITVVMCIGSLALGYVSRGMYDNYRASGGISDEARRDHYLMPQKDSPTYKEWVLKYGDSADAWEMFTLSFHTKYLQELTKKVNTLSRDVNEPNDPNR